ncbi:MAG: cell division protein FtsL [Gammaproteobacteria bacterium]|jgi:cell division protein FtsL
MSRLNILLLAAVLVSAVIVVTVRHKNRLEFIALQSQEQRHDELQAEWGRLMLEKATWTSQHNVADDAKKRLAMSAPGSDKIITLDLNAQKTDLK